MTPDGRGRFNAFANDASIYWTPWAGAHIIRGAIRAKWAQYGWERGYGYPTTDELNTPGRVGGKFNRFDRGKNHIYWSASTGAHTLSGAIFDRWAQAGFERSRCGLPSSDEHTFYESYYSLVRAVDFEGSYGSAEIDWTWNKDTNTAYISFYWCP
jgi:uncharacterized protein with LGFP repeats